MSILLYLASLFAAVGSGIGLAVVAGWAACPCRCHGDEPAGDAFDADEQQWQQTAETLGFPTHDYHHSRKDHC